MSKIETNSKNAYRFITTEFPEFINNTELGLCLVNRKFEIVWANKTQAKWFGPLKKICGHHCYETFEHNPEVCGGCPVLKTFKTGKPSHSEPRIGYTRNGKIKFYELSTSPVKNSGGRVEKVLEVVRDITDRKLYEDESAGLLAALKKQEKELINKSKMLKILNRQLWRTNNVIRETAAKLNESNNKIKLLNESLRSKVTERSKELQLAGEEIATLYTLGKKIVSTLNLGEVLGMIVKDVTMLMATEAAAVRLLDDNKKYLVLRSSCGLSPECQDRCKIIKVESGVADFVNRKSPVVYPNLPKAENASFRQEMLKEGFTSLLIVPIIFKNEVLGSIISYSKKARIFTEREIELLRAFASQAAIAIKNARLHESVNLNYYNTINTLSLAVEARDPYTRGHSERVTNYAIAIGKKIGLNKEELSILRYSGRIHDIGKIAVSDMILLKPGKLTPTERAQVELHVIKGVEILAHLKFLEPGIPIIKHHHERFDGSGYPDGLKEVEIPVGARILSVADAFDAMTSERPYRSALTLDEAMDDLKRNSGLQFDPIVVTAFLEILAS